MADQIRPFPGPDLAAGVAHTTPPSGFNDDSAPEGAGKQKRLSEKDLQKVVLLRLLDELQRMNDMSTRAVAERHSSQVVNGVLDVATVTFDASGTFARSYQVPVGSIRVTNPAASAVTVQSGVTGSPSAPPTGRGIHVVPAGASIPVAIGAHAVTFWGTAAAQVSFQTFTGMQAFGVGTR
jgi:hypothetical protein